MDKHLGLTPRDVGNSPGAEEEQPEALGWVTSQGMGGAGQLSPSGAIPAKKGSGATTCELCPERSLEVNN